MLVPPIYPIIDVDLCRMRGIEPLALVADCLSGGARLLQIRMKTGGSGWFLNICRAAVEEARACQALIVVNDRPDIAAMAKASGVHVGQADLPARSTQQHSPTFPRMRSAAPACICLMPLASPLRPRALVPASPISSLRRLLVVPGQQASWFRA